MYGTKNMVEEPAMSREQAAQAILVGIRKVKELAEQGYDLIATGEMGIGNTTTSSAVVSVLLDESVENMIDRTSEKCTCHSGNIKPSDFGQDI